MSEIATIQTPITITSVNQPTTLVVSVNRGERGDSGNTSKESILLNVDVDNQTVFALPLNPPTPTKTALIVNGVEYEFLDSYTLSNHQLTWLNSPFPLKAGYRVKLYY